MSITALFLAVAMTPAGGWNVKVEADGQRCAIIAAPSRLAELLALPPMKQNWLLNLTDDTLHVPAAQTYREDGSEAAIGEIVSGGMGIFQPQFC